MRKLACALALLAAPVAADGIEITVAGEANGVIVIDLFEDVAPQHAERIAGLAEAGEYDGVVFHRVIAGFMAQTGDVQYGDSTDPAFDMRRAGTGGSAGADLPAEFSDRSYEPGVVGMARTADPDSANSQFFIMFAPAPHLNGQYMVVGRVIDGQEVVDAIKLGTGRNGAVEGEADRMVTVRPIELP